MNPKMISAIVACLMILPFQSLHAQEAMESGDNLAGDVGEKCPYGISCIGMISRVGPEDEAAQKAYNRKKTLQAEVAIYPVPAERELTIEAPDYFKGDTELLLFDPQGHQFFIESITSEALKDFKLDLDKINLSSGVYYIRLLNNGNSITRKFVKK